MKRLTIVQSLLLPDSKPKYQLCVNGKATRFGFSLDESLALLCDGSTFEQAALEAMLKVYPGRLEILRDILG